ncbi:MAG: TlpA disulfide reductase family protein, partial [Candidatus Thiodiazotropha sp. 6PLUC5]
GISEASSDLTDWQTLRPTGPVTHLNSEIFMRIVYQRLITASLLFMLLTSANGGWLEEIKPSKEANNIELFDINNQKYSLSGLNGRVVLVNFWASWCPPCIEEMPSMTRLVETISSDRLVVLAVNVKEKRARVERIATRLELNFPVLLDQKKAVADAWGIKVYPSSFLIDSSGRMRFKAIGPVEWDSDEVVAYIKQLLAEEAP